MTRWRPYGIVWAFMGCAVLLFSYVGCRHVRDLPVENVSPPPQIRTGSSTQGAVGDVVNLEQGWIAPVQERWYYTSQGTQIILYSWFLNLEQAGSTEPIRSNDNMARLRYLLQDPTLNNPDGLPVGFVKDVDPDLEPPIPDTSQWFGVTCAACHTGQFTFEGRDIRVDGGPGMGDFNKLLFDLILPAMESTRDDAAKFDRFKNKVGDPDGTLMQRLIDRIGFLHVRDSINAPPPGRGGYARLDAVNNIFNAVGGQDMGLNNSPNTAPADAPVDYPAVWDAPHTDLVQWAGFFNNRSTVPPDTKAPDFLIKLIEGSGPVIRNLGEVLGVVGTFQFKEEFEQGGYESSARITQQGWLEAWLTDLWSPRWPESILPAIDSVKAARGKELYLTYCITCHVVMEDTRAPDRVIRAQMWPLHFIGTDPENASDFTDRGSTRIPLATLPRTRSQKYIIGPVLGDSATTAIALTNAIVGILARQPAQTVKSAERSAETRVPIAQKFDPKSYRSRPLNGVWATSPFLHNGSVANLWELMLPVAERRTSFLVGNRVFDPDSVGYSTSSPSDGHATMLDTSLRGNLNTGHEYGVHLSDDEKWAIIEYIKSL